MYMIDCDSRNNEVASCIYDSIVGTVLLVAGLYGVLWGQNRESKQVESSQETTPEDPKDEYDDDILEPNNDESPPSMEIRTE